VSRKDSPSSAYYDFVDRIKKHGEKFPKKHGEWYRIKVLDKFITLDTWNGSIVLHGKECEKSGNDIYGNLVCFHSSEREQLAINFGGYSEHQMMNFWRLHIC
jgi:hypothetical protein